MSRYIPFQMHNFRADQLFFLPTLLPFLINPNPINHNLQQHSWGGRKLHRKPSHRIIFIFKTLDCCVFFVSANYFQFGSQFRLSLYSLHSRCHCYCSFTLLLLIHVSNFNCFFFLIHVSIQPWELFFTIS